MHFVPIPEAVDFIDLLCARKKSGTRAVQQNTKYTLATIISHCACFSVLSFASICAMALGGFTIPQLSQFCRRNSQLVENLVSCAVLYILSIVKSGSITFIIDDSDRPRSKMVKAIGYVFKTICKKTNGFHMAQNIVFVCVVTKYFIFPIAWKFYIPDPKVSKWRAERKKLRAKNKSKKKKSRIKNKNLVALGKCPKRDAVKYPSKLEIATILLTKAKNYIIVSSGSNNKFNVVSISADAAYLSPDLCDEVYNLFPKAQLISQMKSTQMVCRKRRDPISVKDYFRHKTPQRKKIAIRGKDKIVEFMHEKLVVKSHGKKLFVIAVRYEGEEEYRYIVATKLSWRPEDIIIHYGLRWLVEVDIQDWKQHSGFGKGACMQGDEGSSCALNLSMLSVYLLLTHPLQLRRLRSGLSFCTMGSLAQRLYVNFFMHNMGRIILSEDPKKSYNEVKDAIEHVFALRDSEKHPGNAYNYPEIKDCRPWYKRFAIFSPD